VPFSLKQVTVEPYPAFVAGLGKKTQATSLVPAEFLPISDDGDGGRALPTPAMITAHLTEVNSLIKACLREGSDFGTIPSSGRKRILFASGAEKLLALYGLGHRLERIEVDLNEAGNRVGVTYRATITKLVDGQQIDVASCDGYAGRDERALARAEWNSVIKRAEKRALVGAAKQATATSGLFDEDEA
jgi:hypothetical protein